MLTFCETCIWKLETDDVCRDELNLFELFVLWFCFLFSVFPSNVLGVLFGKFSADHLVPHRHFGSSSG